MPDGISECPMFTGYLRQHSGLAFSHAMTADPGAISTESESQAVSFELLPDSELVKRICGGCQESLLHLVVDRCGGLIRQVAREYRYDGDLAHEVCVHLFGCAGDWSRLQSWRGKSALGGWIRTVAIHLCLNQWRSQVKYRRRFQRLLDESDPPAEDENTQADRLADLPVARSQLLEAIDQLSDRDQTVILLHCLGDPPLSIEALAALLQVSVEAARTIKCRAIQRLGDILRIKGGADD